MNRMRYGFFALLSAGALALTACSGAGSYDASVTQEVAVTESDAGGYYDMAYDEYEAAQEAGVPDVPGRTAATSAAHGRKIITTIYLRMESTSYDSSVQAIHSAMNAAGGIVEFSEITGHVQSQPLPEEDIVGITTPAQDRERYLSMRIRVPQEQLSGFLARVEGAGNILSKQESAQDITLAYVDVESRVKSLRAQRDRVLEMLEEAKTIKDMLSLEERLSEIRYELERYESQLNVYKDQVSLATVNIDLQEVWTYTEAEDLLPAGAGVGQRISYGVQRNFLALSTFFVNFFVWLVVNFVYILLLGLAAVLLVRLYVKRATGRPGGLRQFVRTVRDRRTQRPSPSADWSQIPGGTESWDVQDEKNGDPEGGPSEE